MKTAIELIDARLAPADERTLASALAGIVMDGLLKLD